MQRANEMNGGASQAQSMPSTVSVHRCRFVDYTPTAITAIAFPPLPLPAVKGKGKDTGTSPSHFGILAVGRANGNVELLEWTGTNGQAPAPQAWVAKKVCRPCLLVENSSYTTIIGFTRPSAFKS